MMEERNLTVDHTTIYRWVQRYAPELEKRSRLHLRPTNDSYRVDETYIKIKEWYYLYRAVEELKDEGVLSVTSQLRQSKYLNNIVEQDHRFIKRRVNPGLGFFSFKTARRTIGGFETMNMIQKGQVEGLWKGDIRGQVRFVESLFNVAA
jgi:transposase, IS6 family